MAQAWRGGARQALLARLLAGTAEYPLGPEQSRRVGALCAATPSDHVIDAHVALLASDHDTVVTSDTDDLRPLLAAARSGARVVSC